MSKTALFTQKFAELTGSHPDQIGLKVRRLREAGLFVKESRSPRSPVPGPREASHVIFMWLCDLPAKHAEMAIDRGSCFGIHADDFELLENYKGKHAIVDFMLANRSHSFLDFLEKLLELAMADPSEFLFPSELWDEFCVTFYQIEFFISINFFYSPSRAPLVDCIVNYCNVRSYSLRTCDPPQDRTSTSVSKSAQIGGPFIGKIAVLLNELRRT